MNRLPICSLASRCLVPSRTVQRQAFAFTAPAVRGYGTTSSPKSAEGPSAQSGGARSKEAAETGSSPTGGVIPDGLAEGDARGRTGGGRPLESSRDPPPQPKILNAAVNGGYDTLSDEQKAEVDEHNRDFDRKHDKAPPAAGDKVDKSFWSGEGGRHSNPPEGSKTEEPKK